MVRNSRTIILLVRLLTASRSALRFEQLPAKCQRYEFDPILAILERPTRTKQPGRTHWHVHLSASSTLSLSCPRLTILTLTVPVRGVVVGTGTGTARGVARRNAADMALQHLHAHGVPE